MPRYAVSFVIEGDNLGDDYPLTEENLREFLLKNHDFRHEYQGNDEMDTKVSSLKIEQLDP